MVLTFLSLQRFSEEAWEGLEKPLGTFRTETFAECGEKCSELEGCGMMHFNRHDNRGYKWCTPAKVVSLFYFPSLICYYFTFRSVFILRLAASNQTIRSARRSPAMATFLVREISLSTCLLKFLSVSQLSSFRTLHTFAIVLFIYSFLRSDGSPTSSQRFEQQIDKTLQTLAIIQNFRRDPLL